MGILKPNPHEHVYALLLSSEQFDSYVKFVYGCTVKRCKETAIILDYSEPKDAENCVLVKTFGSDIPCSLCTGCESNKHKHTYKLAFVRDYENENPSLHYVFICDTCGTLYYKPKESLWPDSN